MQKIWSRLILETVLLAFLSTAGAYAQSPDIEIEWFNEAGGIELDGGGAVFQDRFGYMWFGTFSGLYKYDGYEFEIFVHDPNDSTSISGSWIETFYEDSRGDLWIGTYSDGINRFNRESNTFTRFEHDPKDETSISIGQISVLFEDRRGTFWVGSQKGLDQFDVESGTFSHYVHPTNDPSILKDSWIVSIVEDKVGRLWIGTENNKGVFRYDPQTGSFTHYTHNAEDPKSLYHNSVHYILQDSRGDIWITTAKGVLHRFDEATESFERFNLDPAESGGILRAQTDNFESWTDAAWATLHLFEAKQNPGHLWISSTIGLFRLNLTTHQLNFYNDGASSMPRLKNQQSWGFAEDDTGVIWATSTSGGAHKIRFKKTWLTHYTPGGTNRGLSQNQIGVLGENEDGTIRLHYSDYTYDLLDQEKGEIIGRENLRERLKPYNLSSFREAFVVGTSILLVMEDQEWIYFNPTTDAQKQITVPEGFQIRSAPFEDRLGNIWFSCNDLCKYDSESGTIKSVYTFDDRQVRRILGEDSDGGKWFNTYTDDSIYLARYDVKKRTLSYYTTNGHRADWWVEDKNGDFWVGTFQGGLIKLKNEQEIEKVFGLDRGLPNYHVTGPLLDHEGYLWFGTASKLVRLDPNDETMTFLSLPGEFDGKPFSTAFNRTLVSSRGHFYIASLGRLLQISPDLFEPNSLVPPLVLTDLLIDNLSVDITGESPLSKPISLAENVRLSFEERDITLEFSVLDFENPEANTYSYKLENYDENWVQAGTRRTATYTNLDPGQYTFRVKGANSLGVWNEEGASIGITILPPWWRTVWAFVVYGLLFVVGIVGVNRFQRNRIVSRERLRAEREKAKAIEATNNELERALKHLTETQDQLIHTEKMASLGQLTAGIAHEIKNPLNFVNNFSRLSADVVEDLKGWIKEKGGMNDPDVKEMIDTLSMNASKINEHGQRADGIIRSMLEHSRTGRGERRATNLNKLVEEYLNLAYHGVRARENGFEVDLNADYDETIGEVEIYPQEIGRVLINLFDNAFYTVNERRTPNAEPQTTNEYIPKVDVQTKKTSDYIEIKVTDNGMGISENIQEKIFEPFFTTKPTGSGTGLGLSLSHDIVVKGHGGQLEVESEVGEGSVFVVRVPIKT